VRTTCHLIEDNRDAGTSRSGPHRAAKNSWLPAMYPPFARKPVPPKTRRVSSDNRSQQPFQSIDRPSRSSAPGDAGRETGDSRLGTPVDAVAVGGRSVRGAMRSERPSKALSNRSPGSPLGGGNASLSAIFRLAIRLPSASVDNKSVLQMGPRFTRQPINRLSISTLGRFCCQMPCMNRVLDRRVRSPLDHRRVRMTAGRGTPMPPSKSNFTLPSASSDIRPIAQPEQNTRPTTGGPPGRAHGYLNSQWR